MKIYIDADACPVKEETYRVARRYELTVTLVSNSWMRSPGDIELRVVEEGFDAADDWIAENVAGGDIVVTGDIPLAKRCIDAGAAVIDHRGRLLDEDDIGSALAMRDLLDHLRGAGNFEGGGPPPFDSRDRSTYLQKLDQLIQRLRRGR